MDKTSIENLIRQLDAPGAGEREEAVKALRGLGPQAVPILEEAAEEASFEARIELEGILEGFSTRGTVVLHSISNTAGHMQGIRAGDVITAVNGIPIESYEDFMEKAKPLENSARTLTVRNGPRIRLPSSRGGPTPYAVRMLEVGPGVIGVYLGDYDGRYDHWLSLALQRIYRSTWTPQWAEAREDFERAIAAGLMFDDDTLMQPMYGAACYYAGDPEAAYAVFDDFVRRNADKEGWWLLTNGLGRVLDTEGHLYLHFARRQLQHDPESAGAAVNIAYAYSWSQSRYIEATTVALAALDGRHGELADYGRGVALNAMQNALNAMDLVPEAGEAARRLAEIDDARELYGKAFRAAERSGQYELAMKLGEEEIRRSSPWRRYQPSMADNVVRMCFREGRLDDARRVLAAYDDVHTLHVLIGYLSECDIRWSESQEVLAEFARRCLAEEMRDNELFEGAFMILSRLTEVDLAELERIVHDRLEESRSTFSGSDPTDYRRYLSAMLALMKEEHEEVAKHLKATKHNQGLPLSFRAAARFLQEHGDALEDEQRLWKRTFRAFERPAGGYYLLTRDQHTGLSDGQHIRRIPLPETVWSFDDPIHAFEVSETGQTVLTVGHGHIYRLAADESGWERLCEVPSGTSDFSIAGWGRILDDFVEVVEAGDGRRDLAWPTSRNRYRRRESPDYVMFSDGTWVVMHPEVDHLVRVSEEVAKIHEIPLEIHDIKTAGSEGTSFWLYTDQGLMRWNRLEGEVTRFDLPGVREGAPVMTARRVGTQNPGGRRFSLFPGDGGTTFIIHRSSGDITHEGLVNEALPETYWRRRTPEFKRKRLMEELARQGLTWPPPEEPASRPAD